MVQLSTKRTRSTVALFGPERVSLKATLVVVVVVLIGSLKISKPFLVRSGA